MRLLKNDRVGRKTGDYAFRDAVLQQHEFFFGRRDGYILSRALYARDTVRSDTIKGGRPAGRSVSPWRVCVITDSVRIKDGAAPGSIGFIKT